MQHRRGRCGCKIATIGTIFRHTHLPLQKWFLAILLMLNAKKLQPWTRILDCEFYRLLYELRGWAGPEGDKRLQQVG